MVFKEWVAKIPWKDMAITQTFQSRVGSRGNKKKATDVTSNKIWLNSPLAGQESSFIGNWKST